MTKTANDLAQEYERREKIPRYAGDQPATTRGLRPVARGGTFRVWKDGDLANEESEKITNVTVQLQAGCIIVDHLDPDAAGVRLLFFPEPGWVCEFEPNDARE